MSEPALLFPSISLALYLSVGKSVVSHSSLLALRYHLAMMVSPPTPVCCCQWLKWTGNSRNQDTEEREPLWVFHSKFPIMQIHTALPHHIINKHRHAVYTITTFSLSLTAPLCGTNKWLGVAASSWRKSERKSRHRWCEFTSLKLDTFT